MPRCVATRCDRIACIAGDIVQKLFVPRCVVARTILYKVLVRFLYFVSRVMKRCPSNSYSEMIYEVDAQINLFSRTGSSQGGL